jgi:O-methyltransferase
MNKGAYMMFDDYGFLSCPGVKIAVDDFFKNKPETPLYVATGQCLVIKQ